MDKNSNLSKLLKNLTNEVEDFNKKVGELDISEMPISSNGQLPVKMKYNIKKNQLEIYIDGTDKLIYVDKDISLVDYLILFYDKLSNDEVIEILDKYSIENKVNNSYLKDIYLELMKKYKYIDKLGIVISYIVSENLLTITTKKDNDIEILAEGENMKLFTFLLNFYKYMDIQEIKKILFILNGGCVFEEDDENNFISTDVIFNISEIIKNCK